MAGSAFLRGARVANAHKSITPSDTQNTTTELPLTTLAIYIPTAGDVTAEMWGGTAEVLYPGVPAGSYLQGNFRYVLNTGTTTTTVVVLYSAGA